VVVQQLTAWIQESSGQAHVKVGIILFIHTFGDYLAYHPPFKSLQQRVCLMLTVASTSPCRGDLAPLSETFRHALLKALLLRVSSDSGWLGFF
jgi:hypothetical protein